MATLYLARYLLPIDAPATLDGALLVEEGRITAIGGRRELTAAHGRATIVDFGAAALLPPLVNAHTHLELTHFPRWAKEAGEEGDCGSFVDWILRVIRVKRSLPLERYTPSLKEGISRSLAAGTGAVGDILSCFAARSAYSDAPLMGRLYFETLGIDPQQGRKILQKILSLVEEQSAGQMQLGISPHSPYSLSDRYLEQVLGSARRNGCPSSVHLAESREEVDFLFDSQGDIASKLYPFVGWGDMVPPPQRRSPVAYLAERGGLVPSNLLVHGVQVDARDADRIAGSGATVVLCPRSNAALDVGDAPVAQFLAAGVPLALGTDSMASCDTLSVWDEIAFARRQFGDRLSPLQLLHMATISGASALGLEKDMGRLAAGMPASFQVVQCPDTPPLSELEEALCQNGTTEAVSSLYLHGKDVLQSP